MSIGWRQADDLGRRGHGADPVGDGVVERDRHVRQAVERRRQVQSSSAPWHDDRRRASS